MITNPQVRKILKNASNDELLKLVRAIYRYDSKSGKSVSDAIRYEEETGDRIGKDLPQSPGLISMLQTIESVFKLCPDFVKYLETYSENLKAEEKTFTLLLTKLAEYIVEKYRVKATDELIKVFELIESFLVNGEKVVQDSIVTTLLENIQNISGNQEIDPEVFRLFFGKQTSMWWDEINRFWNDLEKYYIDQRNHPAFENGLS